MIQKIFSLTGVVAITLMILFAASLSTSADTISNPSLIISQVKVTTSSQFVSIYNNTSQPIDMAAVTLQYFNNYQLNAVTSTKSIQLSGILPANSYYIVNDGPINLCYQALVQSASLGFSSKAGMVQVVRLSQQNDGNISLATQDFVRWSSTAVAGVQTIPAEPVFLQRQQTAGKPIIGSWQQVKLGSPNPCQLVSVATPNSPIATSTNLLPASPPPATILSTANPSMAATNQGLMAPQLSELLPNPATPQTDAKDEFIEVYNANKATFDLSGYKLQTASGPTATKRSFTFPKGTTIPGKSFAAYPSSNISVSLTNSGGQVWLLDPAGKVISQSQVYGKAEDGQAWALANGKWYWTSRPTPNSANIVAADSKTKQSGQGVGTVKGVSTAVGNASSQPNGSAGDNSKPRALNSVVLVAVGVLALLYGVYEYRRDMANAVHKLKRNRAARRENRPKS